MGLISAGLNALGGTLASQWKEYFYCESMPANVLATKAMKRINGRFGGSKTEDDNVISEGSIIVVNDGQAMVIVDQGKIVDFCAEPGEYTYACIYQSLSEDLPAPADYMLTITGKSRTWLNNVLSERKLSVKNIFLMTLDDAGNIHIVKQKRGNVNRNCVFSARRCDRGERGSKKPLQGRLRKALAGVNSFGYDAQNALPLTALPP